MLVTYDNFAHRGPSFRHLLMLPAAPCCRRSCLRLGWFWVQSILKMLTGIALPVLLLPSQLKKKKKSMMLSIAENLNCCRGRKWKIKSSKMQHLQHSVGNLSALNVWPDNLQGYQHRGRCNGKWSPPATAYECRRREGYWTASKKQVKKWAIGRKL